MNANLCSRTLDMQVQVLGVQGKAKQSQNILPEASNSLDVDGAGPRPDMHGPFDL